MLDAAPLVIVGATELVVASLEAPVVVVSVLL